MWWRRRSCEGGGEKERERFVWVGYAFPFPLGALMLPVMDVFFPFVLRSAVLLGSYDDVRCNFTNEFS